MTPAPRRGCFGRSIITIVVVLIVACIVVAGLAYVIAGPAISGVFNSITAPISASNDFMNALIAKDYTKAYGMIIPSQQSSFGGSPDGMQQLLSGKGMLPSSVSFTDVHTNGDAIVNGTGSFNGSQKYIVVNLSKDGDAWKILGLDISDTAPTATPIATSAS